jgi:translation initiation factor 2 beta subunit (eIF-2beta)/eIF-5
MENDYSYSELLNRIYKKLKQCDNVNTIPTPKKYFPRPNYCVWINFQETCLLLNRHPKHLCNFILDSYKIKCKKNENNIYILNMCKYKINLKQILQSYIKTCVQCCKCNNINTIILKDNTMKCNNCNTISQSKKDIIGDSDIGDI